MLTQVSRIYLSSPHMSGLEQQYVQDAVASNWIASLAPHVDAFEAEFAAAAGSLMPLRFQNGAENHPVPGVETPG